MPANNTQGLWVGACFLRCNYLRHGNYLFPREGLSKCFVNVQPVKEYQEKGSGLGEF